MTTTPFGTGYARAYDALYETKNYDAECDVLERAFRERATAPVKTLLDLGCGTGGHAVRLARRGYQVTGIDRSPGMLEAAQAKAAELQVDGAARFAQGDVRSFDLGGQTFDAAAMLFAVLGYQTTNEDVLSTLRAVRRHLVPGGLFVFDVWYGPGVLTDPPGERIKEVPTAEGSILRVARGDLDVGQHTCTVSYDLLHIVGDRIAERTREAHPMRFFFPLELELFLSASGFALKRVGRFEDIDRDPAAGTWNVWVIAEAV
jgi:SAM-dependent methyltransferase